jgi:NADPH:quinone reductase-like Zn-dependent oxidoreductase
MAKAIIIQPGGGFDRVTFGERDALKPGPGEITVKICASSLNYHDYAVVSGMWGPAEPRIPMSDGAGEVTVIGTGVTEFSVGDKVVSTFFPTWLDGPLKSTALRPFQAMESMGLRATSSPRP